MSLSNQSTKKNTVFFDVQPNTLSDDDKKNMLLVAKVENIYMNIKEEPTYFNKSILLILSLVFVNALYVWLTFFIQYSPLKNNQYCLDNTSNEFIICEAKKIDKKVINNYIYQDTYYDYDILKEIEMVNKKYKKFFLKDLIYFSIINYDRQDRFKSIIDQYSVIIYVTYKEQWNFSNSLRIGHRESFLPIGIFMVGGIILGAICGSFITDVLGRRKQIMISSLLLSLSCLGIFIFLFIITESHYYLILPPEPENNIKFNKAIDFTIEYDLDEEYKKDYIEILSSIYRTREMNKAFDDYKIIFLILVGISAYASVNIDIASLSYIMEISINEASTYWNYCTYWMVKYAAFAICFIILTLGNNIYVLFFIIGILLLVIYIMIAIFIYESPRYNFEFSDYTSMTKFFYSTVTTNDLDKLYIDPLIIEKEKPVVVAEIERNEEYQKESITDQIMNKLMFFSSKKTISKIKRKINKYEYANVTRSELIRNPFIMYHILMFDKHLRKNFLILLSLSFNIFLINYLVSSSFCQYFVYARSDLYYNWIINQYPILLAVTMLISSYIYFIIIKYLGYIRLMFVSFMGIFICSIICEVINLFNKKVIDLNSFEYNSSKYEWSEKRGWLNFFLCIITFFSYGLCFIQTFYVIQFSKTISRCMIQGVVKITSGAAIILSSMINQNFDKSFFYMTIASITGWVHCYFIYSDFDFSIITDFRKIEIESFEKADKNEKLGSETGKNGYNSNKHSSNNVNSNTGFLEKSTSLIVPARSDITVIETE